MNFATQSPSQHPDGLHVGIIMDGNGRWAQARGRQRLAGHRRGAEAVDVVVEAARRAGLGTLTLYAFSADNWRRPELEVAGLMRLLRRFLRDKAERCRANGIRLSVIGRRDRLAASLVREIERAERHTEACEQMRLQLAVDYSAREAIIAALTAESGPGLARGSVRPEREDPDFAARLGSAMHAGGPAQDVDLIIRTGGEQRLSDFLLWEAAYAELYFTDVAWPEFGAEELQSALDWFASRQRRYGGVPTADAAAAEPAATQADSKSVREIVALARH
jgi:undecaprenyl diphosphate synthase